MLPPSGCTSIRVSGPVGTEPNSVGLNMPDLELMHHYVTVVSSTLSDRPAIQDLWQIAIPKEALAHPFLMHGLLAISALHLAHNETETQARYRDLAMKHYNVTLLTFRPMLSQITNDNCHSLFAASSVVAIFALALPQTPGVDMLSSPIDEMIKISELGRGVYSLVKNASEWIKQGNLGPYLQLGIMQAQAALPRDVSEALARLRYEISASEEDENSKATYSAATALLEKAFKASALTVDDAGFAVVWLILVDHEYIDALKKKRPMAIIILAHYGVALHDSRHQWWSGKWGYQLVSAIYDSLNVESRGIIQWPAQRLRMDTA